MPKGSRILAAGLTWLASAGFYLMLVSSYGIREYVTAAVTAGVATAAALVFSHTGKVAFRFRFRDIVQVWRMPWYVVSGTGEVLKGLAKQLFSAEGALSVVAAVPFDVGERDDLKEAGRRALAATYTSATPNSMVLGTTDQEQWLLFHQIVPGGVRKMTENLGARL